MLFVSIHKVLRNGISPKNFLIHATDNIQETKDNQRALGQPEEYKQRQFDTLRQVFDVLNFSGIPYVILRNFEKMPDEVNVDPNHLDVDILVNDYYALKRIVDGDSPQEFFRDHCENGFYRVVNYVLVGGKRISFDVRSIGDNYLDEKWQKDILERRVEFRSGIYVPSEEDHLGFTCQVRKITCTLSSIMQSFRRRKSRKRLSKCFETLLTIQWNRQRIETS